MGGYTAGQFAAYYIVWTLVHNINIVFTPYGWEWRIQKGQLSGQLLKPMHPIHYDLGYFAGWKAVVVVLWLPIAVVLSDENSKRRPIGVCSGPSFDFRLKRPRSRLVPPVS